MLVLCYLIRKDYLFLKETHHKANLRFWGLLSLAMFNVLDQDTATTAIYTFMLEFIIAVVIFSYYLPLS